MTTIVFVTMGESLTYQSLEAIKKWTPKPYNLLIWYNGSDSQFSESLRFFSDNVISCTTNQGLLEAMNYAFINSQSEFILFTCAGVIAHENYFRVNMKPFEDEKVGIVAEYQFPTDEYVECGYDNIPEGIETYRKAMINDIGAMCPSFLTWGTAPTELKYRALAKGWKVIGTSKIATHNNKEGEGKDLVGDDKIRQIMLQNNVVFNIIKNRDYNYDWWRTDMLDESVEDDYVFMADRLLY